MTPTESPRRVHLLTALVLGGTFLAGAVSGAGVLRWLAPPAAGPERPAAQVAPPLPAARLPRELHLTPEQEAKARLIGERYQPELEALAKEIRPKVRAVQDRMEAEFAAVLTEAQKQQLAAVEQRRRNPPKDGDRPPPQGRHEEGPPASGPDGGPAPGPPAAPPGAPSRAQGAPGATASGGPARGDAGGGAKADPAGGGRPAPGPWKPPPQPSIDACLHLDLDQLCRFSNNGREHEGSCRKGPEGQGPLHCAPDRHMAPAPAPERR